MQPTEHILHKTKPQLWNVMQSKAPRLLTILPFGMPESEKQQMNIDIKLSLPRNKTKRFESAEQFPAMHTKLGKYR